MKRVSKFVSENNHLSLILVLFLALAIGGGTSLAMLNSLENARLEGLQTASERLVIEILSETQNSNLMGAVSVLGLVDPYVKREALRQLEANNKEVFPTIESVGRAYKAEGVFIVSNDGIISSSWDNTGKSSTALDVNFRPYFKTAMNGTANIYAAVSIARGDRSLYFSAPIYSKTENTSSAIGAAVARTDLAKIDQLIQEKSDVVLLVSPQGVVFASSDKSHIGLLTSEATPERLKGIRALKQYGKMFDADWIATVPFPTMRGVHRLSDKRFAVAESAVEWNDPNGNWKLVMIENLNRTVTPFDAAAIGLATFFMMLLFGIMILNISKSQHHQREANEKLLAMGRIQEEDAAQKMRLAETSVRLQRSNNVEALLQLFLKDIHSLFGTLQGVVYLCDDTEGNRLQLLASYACDTLPSPTLEMGEGLLGQCALEKRFMILKAGTSGLGMIRSGLGEHLPESVCIAPILLNESLLGVIEVALLHELTESEWSAFKELLGIVAMNIEIVGRSTHAEDLLLAMQAAEQANVEQLNFQQALIDSIPYPVFYKDSETRFLGVNRAYETHFGVQREMLVGKRVIELKLDYMSEQEGIAYQLENEAVVASGESINREIQMVFADGKVHDVLYRIAGFSKQDGTPAGLVGTLIDISEIKQVKNDLKRLLDAEALNSLVKDRESKVEERGGATRDITIRHQSQNDGSSTDFESLGVMLKDFCDSLGVAVAIIDIEGQVLMASNWQAVCSDYHRKADASCALCVESDTEMAMKLDEGAEFTVYKCKNGMTDAGAAVIIDGKHVANVFVGQFHSERPNNKFFREQAQKYGYDEALYLDAVLNAAVIEDRRIPAILNFLTSFAHMLLEQTPKETRS